MQIGAGLKLAHARARAIHPIDLLDASYARVKHDPNASMRVPGDG